MGATGAGGWEMIGATGAGDVHSHAVTVEVDHGAAHGLAVAHDRVLDHARKAAATFRKVAAHFVVAIGENVKEFGFRREADIDAEFFSISHISDADLVAGLVPIECIGKFFDFF